MAKRMRRLHAIVNPLNTRPKYFDQASTRGHLKKEMDDRRRRGWLAKQSRKKNQKVNRRKRGR